jgi:quercetin dioxygenase-like cupin family protein
MTRTTLSVAAAVLLLVSAMRLGAQAEQHAQTIAGVTPADVRWYTPAYYTDGRQRAQLFGDSGGDGVWVDRVKIPAGRRVLAHTHPHDELATVIEGTWYVGEGARFDSAKLKAYPAGSFVRIPAGVPHFVATKDGSVIVQLNGTGKFGTAYLEQ